MLRILGVSFQRVDCDNSQQERQPVLYPIHSGDSEENAPRQPELENESGSLPMYIVEIENLPPIPPMHRG
jgi:hypothetical protein